MLANVFSPDNRNVRMIKRLAEANLVGNDIPATMKYLHYSRQHHLSCKQWAADHTPGMQTPVVKIAKKRQYINKTDTLRLNDNCRMVLLELWNQSPKRDCTRLSVVQWPAGTWIGVFMDDYNKYYALQKRACNRCFIGKLADFYNQNNLTKNRNEKILLFIALISLLASCQELPVTETDKAVPMYPDYTDITIPVNIAPLNFLLRNNADGVKVIANGTELYRAATIR